MFYKKLNKYICEAFKTEIAYKQHELTKVNVKGVKGITQFKKKIKEIDDLLNKISLLECPGIDYIYQGPFKQEKNTSTKLQLNRETDPRKLFIKSGESRLPPKKRSSFRKK